MLLIKLGPIERECLTTVNEYFHIKKKKEWFNRPSVKQIIKEIDDTDAIKDEYLESPILGAISPDSLSTGCKAVILMDVLEKPYIFGTKCGDNCVNSILRIAQNKDVTLKLHHCMKFPESGFELKFLDSGKVVTTDREFAREFYRIKEFLPNVIKK